MKLYLIRHGETVDNVAGLYAGVRDSALTNHGVEQARWLGDYFAKNHVQLTHIFSSPLSRAFKTAEAVRKPQLQSPDGTDAAKSKSLDIVKVPDLIEQNFGFYEGKPFYARSDLKKSGREAHHDRHKDDSGFVDVESRESMAKRADCFLDQHLVPMLNEDSKYEDLVVAIVSHGMLLSHLWKRLLLRLPRKSLTIAPGIIAARENVVLEHLGGWSNTGYLDLSMERDGTAVPPEGTTAADSQVVLAADSPTLPAPLPPHLQAKDAAASPKPTPPESEDKAEAAKDSPRALRGWSTTIVAIDSKQHLTGLKRQRGSIGRLAHDEGQKKLDGFFTKRQKLG